MPPTDDELRDLYQRYGHVIFHRCRRILGNEEDAMDAVQETFARVVRHHDSFRRESSPLTWMYRISTNYCLNQLRNHRERAAKRQQHPAEVEAVAGRVAGAEDWERLDTIRRLLEDVDDETRAIVIHLYFDDLSRQETAALVGISQPTLRKRLDAFLGRARRRLERGAAPALVALAVALLCSQVLP